MGRKKDAKAVFGYFKLEGGGGRALITRSLVEDFFLDGHFTDGIKDKAAHLNSINSL